jgi:hypothetical protein
MTLSGGCLRGNASDANLLTSVVNGGSIEIAAGTWSLAAIDCLDPDSPTGTVLIDPNATLCVGEITQA